MPRLRVRGAGGAGNRLPHALLALVLLLLGACGSSPLAARSTPPPSAAVDAVTAAPTISEAPFTPGGDLLPMPPWPAAAATTAPGPPAAVATVPPNPGMARPNPRLTPGAVFGGVGPDQVCRSDYARKARHVERHQYTEVYGEYGVPYPQPPGTYELDHLIPLELAGDNENTNLWPQPAAPQPGYHQKDDLENRLHQLVCAGQLDLATAQHAIAADWYAAYLRYVGSQGQGGGGD